MADEELLGSGMFVDRYEIRELLVGERTQASTRCRNAHFLRRMLAVGYRGRRWYKGLGARPHPKVNPYTTLARVRALSAQ